MGDDGTNRTSAYTPEVARVGRLGAWRAEHPQSIGQPTPGSLRRSKPPLIRQHVRLDSLLIAARLEDRSLPFIDGVSFSASVGAEQ
jgi:hypothetical protein